MEFHHTKVIDQLQEACKCSYILCWRAECTPKTISYCYGLDDQQRFFCQYSLSWVKSLTTSQSNYLPSGKYGTRNAMFLLAKQKDPKATFWF